jgi:excinuclease ABC subunit B
LPSALDNRPLTFEEFERRTNQIIYVSATPGPYELTKAGGIVVEQVIRPTGLTDPEVEVRPVRGQIDDLLHEIRIRAEKNERVPRDDAHEAHGRRSRRVLHEVGVKCRYLHSEVETLDRIKILRGLRRGEFDVLIGINLLREGLDLPEVSLVAILDADKEGFLRSGDSLIQTMGRAARHLNGRAILYADTMTDSMKRAIDETNRRREIQKRYNLENNITPESIVKAVDMTLVAIAEADYVKVPEPEQEELITEDPEKIGELIAKLETEMREAAKKFEFERAAELRDKARELRAKVL